MYELNRNRSFADARSNPLDRPMPHIADGKNSWHVGLEKIGISFQSPTLGAISSSDEIGTGEDKSALIALHRVPQPIRPGQCANEDEQRACRNTFGFVRIGAQNRDLFEVHLAMHF